MPDGIWWQVEGAAWVAAARGKWTKVVQKAEGRMQKAVRGGGGRAWFLAGRDRRSRLSAVRERGGLWSGHVAAKQPSRARSPVGAGLNDPAGGTRGAAKRRPLAC